MPIYEYECEDCSARFDELRKADEREAPIACPECGGNGRVVFSTFAQSSGTSAAATPCGEACPPGYT